ncbi:MAG: hypothetical protein WBF48_06405 [Halarcobacter sp.]
MIYIISNCTNAKKISPEDQLLLRNYDFSDIDEAKKEWNKTLSNNSSKKIIAKNMYKGIGWNAFLDSEINFSKKFNTELLISSAGYGLIKADDEIVSYGITFAKAQEDSIHNFNSNNSSSIWWDSINKFDLDNLNKEAFIFIVVPYEYLIAMENTINKLIELFGKKVFILNVTKQKLPTSYANNILKFDTRFNTFQTGTLTSIIQRCMKWLSNEIINNELTIEQVSLQKYINDFLSKHNTYSVEKRIQQTDEEVITLISGHIQNDNIKSASKGLKKLRSIGFACEQKRYGQLFKQTMNGIKNG